jgi:anaerobic magnesium-protoporphyrin IX monomethyl ester cyclase
MNILLINPRVHLPIDTRTTPHLGLAYLAAVSQRRGDEVCVYDLDVEELPLADKVRQFRPDIVGITANTPQVKSAWRAAQEIKSVWDVPVVIGGPHPSVLPEESAQRPEIDIVVRGEGEETWVELCRIIENIPGSRRAVLLDPASGLLTPIGGITYQTGDGVTHNNPDRPPIADLDGLPWPAYHYFKMERYTNLQPATDLVDGSRSFSIMTSRGCPYRCQFCSQSIMPIKWRARSPQNVADEWEHLVNDLGAQEIGVLDDSANIRVERLMELSDLLVERRLSHVPWIFVNGIRANLVNKELLARMKRAGLLRTAFGVESGDPDILRSIDKKLDLDTIRRAFRDAKEAGLETIGFFIIGLPGETEETMERTIRFACELDPLVANFSMMTPYPGTRTYEIARTQGRLLVNDWDDYVFFESKAHYELPGMPAELIERKWKEAYRRFYLRPHRVIKTLLRPATWRNFTRTARIAWRTIFPPKESEGMREG